MDILWFNLLLESPDRKVMKWVISSELYHSYISVALRSTLIHWTLNAGTRKGVYNKYTIRVLLLL